MHDNAPPYTTTFPTARPLARLVATRCATSASRPSTPRSTATSPSSSASSARSPTCSTSPSWPGRRWTCLPSTGFLRVSQTLIEILWWSSNEGCYLIGYPAYFSMKLFRCSFDQTHHFKLESCAWNVCRELSNDYAYPNHHDVFPLIFKIEAVIREILQFIWMEMSRRERKCTRIMYAYHKRVSSAYWFKLRVRLMDIRTHHSRYC